MSSDSISMFFRQSASGCEAEAEFTSFTEVASQGFCRLVKARRGGRWWMLKTLKPESLSQSRYQMLLRKELDISTSLHHPGIVEVSGMEDVPGLGQCIVMEWIDGVTLGEWMKGEHSRKLRRQVFLQILDAVEYIHSHQVVHRDLKPSNILITRNGNQAKLIDFGLSDSDSHAIFKQPAGTRGYISPEQMEGNITDLRNDIYSLGRILEDLRLGWAAGNIVRRCKEPLEKRYASVGALRKAFRLFSCLPHIISAVLLLAALAVGGTILMINERQSTFINIVGERIENVETFGNLHCRRISEEDKTMELVGGIPDESNHLAIPDSIVSDGVAYRIVGIRQFSFAKSRIRSIKFPASLKYIDEGVFWDTDLEEVSIPNSVVFIGRAVFGNCRKLRKVEIGKALEKADIDVFNGDTALCSIRITAPVPPVMGDQSEQDFSKTVIQVPAASVDLYKKAAEWKKCKHFVSF